MGGNGSLFNHVTARHVSDMQMEMELGEGIGRLELKGEWGREIIVGAGERHEQIMILKQSAE